MGPGVRQVLDCGGRDAMAMGSMNPFGVVRWRSSLLEED